MDPSVTTDGNPDNWIGPSLYSYIEILCSYIEKLSKQKRYTFGGSSLRSSKDEGRPSDDIMPFQGYLKRSDRA